MVVDVSTRDINYLWGDSHGLSPIEEKLFKKYGPKAVLSLFKFLKRDFYYYVIYWDYEINYDSNLYNVTERSKDSCLRFDKIPEIIDYLDVLSHLSSTERDKIISVIEKNKTFDVNFSDNYILRFFCKFPSKSQLQICKFIIERSRNFDGMFMVLFSAFFFENKEMVGLIMSNDEIMSSFDDDQNQIIEKLKYKY